MYNFIYCIPSYNRDLHLKSCIYRVLKFSQNVRAISVAYQTSNSFPVKTNQDELVHVFYSDQIKYVGVARNLAYMNVRHLIDENTIVIFLDDDCHLDSTVESKQFEEILYSNENVGVMRLNVNNKVKKTKKVKMDWLGGGIAILPRVFENIGMWGCLMCRNDMEIYIRAIKNGYQNFALALPNAQHDPKQKGGLSEVLLGRKSINDTTYNPDGLLDLPYIYSSTVYRDEKNNKLKIK